MPSIQETAYPRLKSIVSGQDLIRVYTPAPEEIALAKQSTKGAIAFVGFLVLLKTFQRLGYFIPLAEVPPVIVAHIAECIGYSMTLHELRTYDASGTRTRHLTIIRNWRRVEPYDPAAEQVMTHALTEAARTKDEPADILNVAIEELVRQRFELPAFSTLNRAAQHARSTVYRTFYKQVYRALGEAQRAKLEALFAVNESAHYAPWNALRQDVGSPTLTHFKELIEQYEWLTTLGIGREALEGIPEVKIKHFAAEAKTLDAARMFALEPHKRYTLTMALVTLQMARTLDDLAEMFIKRMSAIHRKGQEALEAYRAQHQQRTDELILTLRDLVVAYRLEGSVKKRFAALQAVIGDRDEQLLEQCDAHLIHSGNNYYPFLWRFYKSHRAALFDLLQAITLHSTSQDTALETALQFALQYEHRTAEWLPTGEEVPGAEGQPQWKPLLDLAWVPDTWWRLVTDQVTRHSFPQKINRRHFEVCLFSQVMWELKSGDLYIEGSDHFADYREQLISWDEYRAKVEDYGRMMGFPVKGAAFAKFIRGRLEARAQATDRAFPMNKAVRIENGEPIITPSNSKSTPAGLRALETLIAERLEQVNVLDLLGDTETWLNWTRFFGPVSGHEAKLNDPVARYLATTFCYGCNLGPAQTARSLATLDRYQVAWANQRHVTEENLEKAIRLVINAYNRFALPKYWGSGRHVAADGTKWNLYDQNLLSEYHVRYGGYGGIGYYHVSDTYIALFSHFIPCGVWEAVYILDGLLKNQSDIQPDIVHADTQGQSAPVFGLAMLLGISLMPRIRNWKDLKLYRPQRQSTYTHIDDLLTAPSDVIDWELIETHAPDMLRVVLSIQAGRITPSTILRRLGTYSRKNKLYQAFRELGRALRTEYLLEYIADEQLRSTIRAATNKNESFNRFTQWLAFGGESTITENDRDEQRKVIKYNHLVANCVIFYNVFAVSRLLRDLHLEGYRLEPEAIAALSPYLTQHINRFGLYTLDLNRRPPPIDYGLFPGERE